MAVLKDTINRIAGKTEEAAAEMIGDGKLRDEGRPQRRKAETVSDRDEAKPLDPLHKLT